MSGEEKVIITTDEEIIAAAALLCNPQAMERLEAIAPLTFRRLESLVAFQIKRKQFEQADFPRREH